MRRSSLLVLALIRVFSGFSLCDVNAAQTETSSPARELADVTQIDPAGIRGTCVLGGGGRLSDAIYERFLQLAGGKQARVLLVPTASKRADTEEGRTASLRRWQDAHPGYHFELLHTRDRAVADSEAFAKRIRSATAIWFGGGSQSRIAEAYVGTRVERELHALLQRGGVVGGSSAGTAIQTRVMIAGGKAPPRLQTGFHLLPFAIADQHFSERKRLPRLQLALDMKPGHFGIGIDEGTAIVVQQRAMTVLGKGSVRLVLPKTATKPTRIRVLTAGEHADLPTWQRAARQRGIGAWPMTKPQSPVVAKGALVLTGGYHVPTAAYERFVALAGGKGKARIVIVPIATPSLARHSNVVQRTLAALGVDKCDTLDLEHPSDVHTRHNKMLEQATGIWFDGGRSWRAIDAIDGTTIPAALHDVLKRGGVIGGMANLQSEFLLRGNPQSPKPLHCEGYDRGLGFLPGCAIDDQFVPHEGSKELATLIETHPQLTGLDLADHSAAVITGSVMQVHGQRVTVVHSLGEQPGAKRAILGDGDQWDLQLAKRTK